MQFLDVISLGFPSIENSDEDSLDTFTHINVRFNQKLI